MSEWFTPEKVHEVHSEFVPSMETCTKSTGLWTSLNNLGFSLCATLSVHYGITTLEEKQSSDKKYIIKKQFVVFVINYQTREYNISTSPYIQVKLKKNSGVLEYSPKQRF